MPSVEPVELGLRKVLQIRFAAFGREEHVVLAPEDQRLRLLVT